jgi:hypothetical protein
MPQSKKTKWNTWKMFTNDIGTKKHVGSLQLCDRKAAPVISFDSLLQSDATSFAV